MKKKLTLAGIFLLAVSLIIVQSCSDDNNPGPATAPVITSIDPLTARVGDTIRITGSNFSTTPSENAIQFNERVNAQVITATATRLEVKVPVTTSASINGLIRITVGGSSVVSTQVFTVDLSMGAPMITKVAPEKGLPGTTITLTGLRLKDGTVASKIFLGDTEAEVLTLTETSATIKIPATHPAGVVAIKAVRADMNSNTIMFTVDPLPATVKATYYTDGITISKATITETGIKTEVLYGGQEAGTAAYSVVFNPADNMLYVNGYFNDVMGVFRAPADGSGPMEQLYTEAQLGGFPYEGLAIDAENKNLYVAASGTLPGGGQGDRILKCNYTDLSAAPVVIYTTQPDDVTDIRVNSGKLYWMEYLSAKVRTAGLDGSSPQTLFDQTDGLVRPYSMAIDAADQKLFVLNMVEMSDEAAKGIYSGSLDGSGTLTKVIGAGDFLYTAMDMEIDVENNQILWMNSKSTGTKYFINRSKYDGSATEVVFPDIESNGAAFFDIDVR